MAIASTIVLTSPDGATEKVRILDDSIRTLKADIQERMDDAGQGLIEGSWLDTTDKELKEGMARVTIDTRANIPVVRLKEGKVFIASDPLVTGVAFQYYKTTGGNAWVDVPIATANLMTAAVDTAKIATSAVTTVKLATGAASSASRAVSIWQTELTNSADTTTATTSWSTPAGIAALTFVLTPEASTSVMCYYLQGHHFASANPGHGGVRIRKTTAGVGGVKTLAAARCLPFGVAPADPQPFSLFGWFTGETAAITVDVQIVESVGATTYHLDGTVALDGDTFPIRYGAFEIKR